MQGETLIGLSEEFFIFNPNGKESEGKRVFSYILREGQVKKWL